MSNIIVETLAKNPSIFKFKSVVNKNLSLVNKKAKYKNEVVAPLVIITIYQQRPDFCAVLLDKGANPNTKYKNQSILYHLLNLSPYTNEQYIPKNISKIISLLSKHNLNGDIDTIHKVFNRNYYQLAEQLIRNCKNLNKEDDKGYTILYLAVAHGKEWIVDYLFKKEGHFLNPNGSERKNTIALLIKQRKTMRDDYIHRMVERLLRAGACTPNSEERVFEHQCNDALDNILLKYGIAYKLIKRDSEAEETENKNRKNNQKIKMPEDTNNSYNYQKRIVNLHTMCVRVIKYHRVNIRRVPPLLLDIHEFDD